MNPRKKMAVAVLVLAAIAMVMGFVFIGQGIIKGNELRTAMRAEQVTLGTNGDVSGNYVDSMGEAMTAAETIHEHRQAIAPTYQDLGKFDPTNLEHLSYGQALNLENYLYLGVVAFGLTTVTLAAGGFMVVTGAALGVSGYALLKMDTYAVSHNGHNDKEAEANLLAATV